LNSISPYSYENGSYLYLEEDSDGPKFVHAYKRLYGISPKFLDIYEDPTPIREFEHFYNE
jgi:hypothetical protein